MNQTSNTSDKSEAEIVKEVVASPTSYAVTILLALTRKGKAVYAGTVPDSVKAKRRARNKMRRVTRRQQRVALSKKV